MRITYDSGLGEYQLLLRDTARPMPVSDIFSITFDGPLGLSISTDRHTLEDGSLSVRDTGFGNVLNGLEFNSRAVAQVGTRRYVFDLSDAAPEVQKFRNCEVAPSV